MGWFEVWCVLRIHDKKCNFTGGKNIEENLQRIAEFGRKFNSNLCMFRCAQQILRVQKLLKWLYVYLIFFFAFFCNCFRLPYFLVPLFFSSVCVSFFLRFNSTHSIPLYSISMDIEPNDFSRSNFSIRLNFCRYSFYIYYMYARTYSKCGVCVEKWM